MFQLKYQEREKKVTIPPHFVHMVLKPNCYIQTILTAILVTEDKALSFLDY